jgi:glycosyltransferase involved in cell wall biosynthesis
MPKVSVVIPSYNSARFVGEAIESVLAQTYVDLEIIVVDDGSTDDTHDVVARFTDPRVRYVYQDNRERSAARNTGIRAAQGEYVAFLDADDLWRAEKLARQVGLLDAHPEVGLVYCGALLMENDRVFDEETCSYRGWVLRPLLLVGNIVAGSLSSAMVRRGCFDRAGLFDETFSACEDWDMWVRIALHYPLDFVPMPLVKCRVHSSNSQKQARMMVPGTERFFEKLLAAPELQDEIRPIRRRVEGLACFIAGRFYYLGRQMGPARRSFLKSLRLDPWRFRTWGYLVRAILGTRITEFARLVHHRLAHDLRYRDVK